MMNNTDYKLEIVLLTIVMILLSLFSGIIINGDWVVLYQYEFSFSADMLDNFEVWRLLLWCIGLLAHLGIFVLPFLINSLYFKRMLLYSPLIYVLTYLFLSWKFFLLIPFMVIWLCTMLVAKRHLKLKIS